MREQPAERARVEPASADREEERVARAASEVRTPVAEPAAEPPRGLLADRHEPLLAALATHVHLLPIEVDVGEIEPDGLRRAEATRVDELDERSVPERERVVAGEPVDRALDLAQARRLGQPARPPGCERGLGDVFGAEARSGRANARPRGGVRSSSARAHAGRGRARPCSPRARGRRRRRARLRARRARPPKSRRSARYARRVASDSAGLARKRSIATSVSTSTVFSPFPATPPMRITLALVLAVAIAAAIVVARQSDDESSATDTGAVTLVGDSLNVGIEPYLAKELPGWRVDAHDRVGRATVEGVDELRALRRSLAPVVVVSLGTNDAEGSEEPVPNARRRRDRGRRAEPVPDLGDRRPRRRRAHRVRPRAPRRECCAPERAARRVGVARLGRSVAPRRRPRPRHPGRLRPACGGDRPRDSRLLGPRG